MKKVGISLVVMVVLLSVMGCSQKEVSSREEALYATKELPGCKEIIYCLSVRGTDDIILPNYYFHIGGSKSLYRVAYIVVYKDNKDSIKMAVWDDKRPPQQVEVEK